MLGRARAVRRTVGRNVQAVLITSCRLRSAA